MLTPKRVQWFKSQKGAIIGIAMCEDDNGKTHYRINVADGFHEQIDVNMIASWGADFPATAGKALFKDKK
jgi:hypothetical protein